MDIVWIVIEGVQGGAERVTSIHKTQARAMAAAVARVCGRLGVVNADRFRVDVPAGSDVCAAWEGHREYVVVRSFEIQD